MFIVTQMFMGKLNSEYGIQIRKELLLVLKCRLTTIRRILTRMEMFRLSDATIYMPCEPDDMVVVLDEETDKRK